MKIQKEEEREITKGVTISISNFHKRGNRIKGEENSNYTKKRQHKGYYQEKQIRKSYKQHDLVGFKEQSTITILRVWTHKPI